MVVTCGGNDGNYATASCLVLDLQNKQWDSNVIGGLTEVRGYHEAVSMEGIGTYIIGGYLSNMKRSTDFLPQGMTEWEYGPEAQLDMKYPCAARISQLSFLVISGKGILEYQVDTSNPTDSKGWQNIAKWPNLQSIRKNPGCSVIGNRMVVAGGGGGTEVLDLESRTIVNGGSTRTPRSFNTYLATITVDGKQYVWDLGSRTVYQYDPILNTWTGLESALQVSREKFGATTVSPQLLCQPC